jgi:hypothetical protein
MKWFSIVMILLLASMVSVQSYWINEYKIANQTLVAQKTFEALSKPTEGWMYEKDVKNILAEQQKFYERIINSQKEYITKLETK